MRHKCAQCICFLHILSSLFFLPRFASKCLLFSTRDIEYFCQESSAYQRIVWISLYPGINYKLCHISGLLGLITEALIHHALAENSGRHIKASILLMGSILAQQPKKEISEGHHTCVQESTESIVNCREFSAFPPPPAKLMAMGFFFFSPYTISTNG